MFEDDNEYYLRLCLLLHLEKSDIIKRGPDLLFNYCSIRICTSLKSNNYFKLI